MTTYTCDGAKIKYTRTRRGVNAKATVLADGKPFLTLDDVAERIVADVEFVDPTSKAKFVADARKAGFVHTSDNYNISEYARKIVADAEAVYADALRAQIGVAKS